VKLCNRAASGQDVQSVAFLDSGVSSRHDNLSVPLDGPHQGGRRQSQILYLLPCHHTILLYR